MSAQKIHASTQKFTEVADILDNIVVFNNGNASLVIEVTASNFALLSKKEQDAKIYAYASLLNSLTFPIQVLIKNRRVDITSYLKSLEQQQTQTKNPLLAQHIELYRNFVHEMIKVNVVLDKTFYVVIGYSSLEGGVTGAKQAIGKGGKVNQDFAASATKGLLAKADSVHSQLKKLALTAKTLQKEELIKLYYDIYNDGAIDATQVEGDTQAIVIKQQA
jgi:hypothetical protein